MISGMMKPVAGTRHVSDRRKLQEGRHTSSFNRIPHAIQKYVPDVCQPALRRLAFEDQPWYPFLGIAQICQGTAVKGPIDLSS